MKIVRIEELAGTEREVVSPAGWTSVRFLLKEDGMGFSFHETTFPAGLQFDMWYKHHVEAVYCYKGRGLLTNRDTGETFDIEPGTLYALSRSPSQLTRSELEIPSGFGRYAARLTSMPRFSARFSAGVIQSSASCGRTSL